jgi:hypothetical protein
VTDPEVLCTCSLLYLYLAVQVLVLAAVLSLRLDYGTCTGTQYDTSTSTSPLDDEANRRCNPLPIQTIPRLTLSSIITDWAQKEQRKVTKSLWLEQKPSKINHKWYQMATSTTCIGQRRTTRTIILERHDNKHSKQDNKIIYYHYNDIEKRRKTNNTMVHI